MFLKKKYTTFISKCIEICKKNYMKKHYELNSVYYNRDIVGVIWTQRKWQQKRKMYIHMYM